MKKLSFSACLLALDSVPEASINRVRSKIKETARPFPSFPNSFPAQTQKEGVRGGQKVSRLVAIFPTTGIDTIYRLLFAGPCLRHCCRILKRKAVERQSERLSPANSEMDLKFGGYGRG